METLTDGPRAVASTAMLVEPIYKGFRIQIDAVQVDGRWDARVNIHKILSDEPPHVERVTCQKLSPEVAE
jgi:hypothetical protein